MAIVIILAIQTIIAIVILLAIGTIMAIVIVLTIETDIHLSGIKLGINYKELIPK